MIYSDSSHQYIVHLDSLYSHAISCHNRGSNSCRVCPQWGNTASAEEFLSVSGETTRDEITLVHFMDNVCHVTHVQLPVATDCPHITQTDDTKKNKTLFKCTQTSDISIKHVTKTMGENESITLCSQSITVYIQQQQEATNCFHNSGTVTRF